VQLHAVAAAGSGAVAGEVERGGEFPCPAGPRKMRAAVAGRCRGRVRRAEAGVRRAGFGACAGDCDGDSFGGEAAVKVIHAAEAEVGCMAFACGGQVCEGAGQAGVCVAFPAEGGPVIAEVEGAPRAIAAAVPAASLSPSSASRPASSAAVKVAWSGTGM
jgi:hypothetical protein